ncbi:DUF2934 domain-containing protein, partial [Mesorhizobium sp. B2-3-13]
NDRPSESSLFIPYARNHQPGSVQRPHIRKRAHELWEREGLMPDREKACWDKAVEEFESGKLTAGRKQAGADAAGDTSGAKH